MFKKKKKEKIKLDNLNEALEIIAKFNTNQKELWEELKKVKDEIKGFSHYLTNIDGTMSINACEFKLYDPFIEEKEITFNVGGEQYSLVPNIRTKGLINKKTAVKIFEIDKTGSQEEKFTNEEDLTKAELERYKKDGFLIKIIETKKEKDVQKETI